MILNNDINVLIAAAGKGTRAKLPYPKTLYKINGEEILLKILNATKVFDSKQTIITSPKGKEQIQNFLINVNFFFFSQKKG